MKPKAIGFFLVLLMVISGCSLAPMNTVSTARSLGEDENNFKFSLPVPGMQYERGIKKNWDVGAGLEYQLGPVFNLYTKYAFINHAEDGLSLAGLLGGGYGTSIGKSRSVYFGPVISYRFNWFEPFFVYRKNYVKWSNDITPGQLDDLLSFIPRIDSFHYDQFDMGINFAGKKWSSAIGFKIFRFKTRGSGIPFIDLGYTF